MARSETHTDAAETPTDHTPEYDTGTLPVEDDHDGRALKARAEHMVVLPRFDKWGEAFETYEVTSESGSTYEVGAREKCGCPDRMFNDPSDGCKHEQRLTDRLNAGAITLPEKDVTPYMTETVPQQVEAFAEDLGRLRVGRQAAADGGEDTEPYTEAIEEVETFISTLAEGYEEYRDNVDEDAPALAELITTDTDLGSLIDGDAGA